MMKWVREFRLIPVALVAIGALFVLKTTGLVFDNGYTLGQRLNRGESIVVTTVPASTAIQLRSATVPLNVASAQPGTRTWAREVFNYPDVTGSVATPPASPNDATIVTGSVAAAKPPEPAKLATAPAAKPAEPPETKPAAPPPTTSAAERAVLERLQERRQQLDARARELDIRESLLKAAEQKFEKAAPPKDQVVPGDANAPRPAQPEASPFKSLVTMYETMKPKDAAKIFDRLDIKVLVEVSTQINPRRMSEILALMTTDAAERLTVELASRARSPDKTPNPAELPKIEGKPLGG